MLDRRTVPLATASFALGVPLVLYGSMVKPYSVDIALTILLTLMAGQLLARAEIRRREALACGLAGALSVWLSNAALLAAAGIGMMGLILARSRGADQRRTLLVAVALPWAVSALAAALVGLGATPDESRAYMKVAWRDDQAFMPFPPSTPAELAWPWRVLEGALGGSGGLGWPLASLFAGLTVLGLWRLLRTRGATAPLLLGPPIIAFAASAFELYPISGRVSLFLTPGWLLGVAAGVGTVANLLAPVLPRAGLAVAGAALAAPIAALATRPPVYRLQEARPLLDWVSARRLPDDPIFVWYRAGPNVRWYGEHYGMPGSELIWGGCWLAEPRRFLRDLDQLRGHSRAWVITSGSGSGAARLLMRYADSLGVRREQSRVEATLPGYLPMEAVLYDFSLPDRLARFSAETFPIAHVPVSAQAIQACMSGPVADRQRWNRAAEQIPSIAGFGVGD
jgi:hypothetical protein